MSYINQIALHDNQISQDFKITPNGFTIVGDIIRLGGSPFTGTSLDTSKHTLNVTGSATGTVSGGFISIATGTTADSVASLVSIKNQRYITGNNTRFITIAAFGDTGIVNNVRRIGNYNATDGFFFQLSGTTFSVVIRKASVDTIISSGSFNGKGGNTYTINTDYHRWEINYTLGKVYFLIDDILIHSISFGSSVLTTTLQFPWQVENNNSGGSTSNVLLNIRGWAAQSIGATDILSDYYNLNAVAETRTLKIGGGKLQKIIITKAGSGNQTVTIYDSTTGSGAIIAVIDATSSNVPTSLDFDVDFINGLTYVSTLTNGSITFTWE